MSWSKTLEFILRQVFNKSTESSHSLCQNIMQMIFNQLLIPFWYGTSWAESPWSTWILFSEDLTRMAQWVQLIASLYFPTGSWSLPLTLNLCLLRSITATFSSMVPTSGSLIFSSWQNSMAKETYDCIVFFLSQSQLDECHVS